VTRYVRGPAHEAATTVNIASEMDTFRLLELPRPLVEDILLLAVNVASDRPANVLALNQDIHEFLRPKFLKSVRLTSIEQVKAFAESEGIAKYGKDIKKLK
jgi:hypothetical protein